MVEKYTKDDVRKSLLRYKQEYGEMPTTQGYKDVRYRPSYYQIVQLYGSWDNAMKDAFGAEREQREKIKFMLDKEFRELLIEKALKNKEIYSIHDLARTLGYSGRNCNVNVWRFKNGQRSIPLEKLIFLCDLANISFDEVYKHVTFLNVGKNVIEGKDIIQMALQSVSLLQISKRIHLIQKEKAIRRSIIDSIKQTKKRKKYTKDDVRKSLLRYKQEYGELPILQNYITVGYRPSYYQIVQLYGSWGKAMGDAFGVERKKYTKEDIKKAMQAYYALYKKIPTIENWKKKKFRPSPSVIQKIYRSWNNCLQEIFGEVNLTFKEHRELKYCLVCGKLTRNPYFCSHKCYVNYNRKKIWVNTIVTEIITYGYLSKEEITSKICKINLHRNWKWKGISQRLQNKGNIFSLYEGSRVIGKISRKFFLELQYKYNMFYLQKMKRGGYIVLRLPYKETFELEVKKRRKIDE